MHEREPEQESEGNRRPLFLAEVGNDGGLRGQWIKIANRIAETEQHLGLQAQRPDARGSKLHDGKDHVEPGFVLLGDPQALSFIAQTAESIIEHGPPFAAWAWHVGGDQEQMARFEDAYVGAWPSFEAFVEQLVCDTQAERDRREQERGESVADSIDPERIMRELRRSGQIVVLENPDGGVWIFRNV